MEKKEEQSRMQIAKWGVSIEWISGIFFLPEDELLLFSTEKCVYALYAFQGLCVKCSTQRRKNSLDFVQLL